MHTVFLCVVPMFHVFGLSVILYSRLRVGNAVVSMGKFDLEFLLKTVQKYRVTDLWIVSPIMIALAKLKTVVNKYDLSSLGLVGSAAAPLTRDVMEDVAWNIPNAAICQVLFKRILYYTAPTQEDISVKTSKEFRDLQHRQALKSIL